MKFKGNKDLQSFICCHIDLVLLGTSILKSVAGQFAGWRH